jgi:hypothetical protein
MRLICYSCAMPRVVPEQLELEEVYSELQPSQDPAREAKQPAGGVARPAAAELLETHGALLTRSDLRELGLERRAVDAVFRALPVVALPGYSRPMIRAVQYLELVEQHTYRDDRVRPTDA